MWGDKHEVSIKTPGGPHSAVLETRYCIAYCPCDGIYADDIAILDARGRWASVAREELADWVLWALDDAAERAAAEAALWTEC